MASALTYAVLELVERAPEEGIAMGALVDALEGRGYAVQDIEQEVWSLLGQRRLTPNGFVCRVMRVRDAGRRRVYEFMLIPWSSERDRVEPEP